MEEQNSEKKNNRIIQIVIVVVALAVAAVGIHSYTQSKAAPAEISQTETNRVGDFFTGLYHRPGCPRVEQIRTGNREDFADNDAARHAGYRPCDVCNPGM